jgi:hypothetical protein
MVKISAAGIGDQGSNPGFVTPFFISKKNRKKAKIVPNDEG